MSVIVIAVLIVATVALALDNGHHRSEVKMLREDNELREKAEKEEGSMITVEYVSGDISKFEAVHTLNHEESGIVLRHGNGNIIANFNPSQIRSIYTEGHLKTEEVSE